MLQAGLFILLVPTCKMKTQINGKLTYCLSSSRFPFPHQSFIAAFLHDL